MLHFNDSSPYSLKSQKIRLKSACALANADIKCLVWGEDALAFIHSVDSNLFALRLVVADHDLPLASNEITKSLPYQVSTSVHKRYVEITWFDPKQAKAFPHSVYLELKTPKSERSVDDPDIIFLHPESQFYLDVHDTTSSVTLPPFPENIRFPTRTAFLDSLIATHLDPPSGRFHTKVICLTLGLRIFWFIPCGINPSFFQAAISNQNENRCRGVSGQKIVPTLMLGRGA